MTFMSFLLGVGIFLLGFSFIRFTDRLLMYFGDISDLFGMMNAPWLSWKLLGLILMVVGFLVAFGLIQTFFYLTLGRLFNFGSSF